MLKLRPPTHLIDAPGIFISEFDGWDRKKIAAERDARLEKTRQEKADKDLEGFLAANPGRVLTSEEEQAIRDAVTLTTEEAAEALIHTPFLRYHYGKTRYQPDAPDWDSEGKPVTARDYLIEGHQPTEFVLRRLPVMEYRDASTITGPGKALMELVVIGLREIRSPPGGRSWKAKKDEDRVPEDVLQSLHEAHVGLINDIGQAVGIFNRSLGEEEKKA